MSFDFYTYINKIKSKPGRNLTEEECNFHLKQKNRYNVETPRPQLGLIRINSKYVEFVDFFHQFRGIGTIFGSAGLIIFLGGIIDLMLSTINKWNSVYLDKHFESFGLLIGVSFIFSPLIFAFFSLIKSEIFRHTHYPIRFNRINRMVYVMRRDKTVLNVPWDELFFTQKPWISGVNTGVGELWAHVLEPDGKTVKETFALFNVTGASAGIEELWEYIRRYMEEGPQEAYENVNYCLPISDRKEPFFFGFLSLASVFNGNLIAQILFSPIFFLIAIGRFVASRTSKIPVWPKDIEEACATEPNDPYAKDWRSNPPYFMSLN